MIIKIIKFIMSVLKLILKIFIITVIGIILIQRFSNNKMTLAGYRIFTVVTESMVPKYNVGDVLLVKSTDIEKIKIGDDVTYLGKVGSFADKIVTHQVIKIENGENDKLNFVTKGIANDTEDPTISEDQIYGIVITKLKIITYLNGIINNKYGMYFLIFVPLAILVFSEFNSYKKFDEIEDSEDEEDEEDEDNENKTIDKKARKRKEKRAKRRKRYE